MADHILDALAAQVTALGIVANRHAPAYESLLAAHAGDVPAPDRPTSLGVIPDDPALPPFSGPLAGMLSAWRATTQDWIWFVPCDMPRLPRDVLTPLWLAAHQNGADIAVPSTLDGSDSPRHHWVCALMHRRVIPTLETAFLAGERKVSRLIAECRWTRVSFSDAAGFANLNTLETEHGGE